MPLTDDLTTSATPTGGSDPAGDEAPANLSPASDASGDTGAGGGDEVSAAVQSKFREVFGNATDDDVEADETDAAGSDEHAEPTVDGDAAPQRTAPDRAEPKNVAQDISDDEIDTRPPSEREAASRKAAPTASAQGVPEAHIQSAKRRGWTDRDIQELTRANPQLAARTFAKLHDDANELARRYAEIGRQQTAQRGQPAPADQRPQRQRADAEQPAQQSAMGLNFDALVNKYGDDLVNDIVRPMQERLVQADEAIAYVRQQKQEALSRTVDGFFGSLGKSFEDFYGGGKPPHQINVDQLRSREKVCEEADAIFAGAAAQGRGLSVTEALEMAHNLVSAGFQQTAIRREMTSKVKGRERQITMRPTHRVSGAPDERDPYARAEATASRKMREIGLTA
jgi:hypothetical protein